MSDKRVAARTASQCKRELSKEKSLEQERPRPSEATADVPPGRAHEPDNFDKEGQVDVPRWLREGRVEGYPDCCILFFHRIWCPFAQAVVDIITDAEEGELHTDEEERLFQVYFEHRKHLDGTGYVPCPRCLAVRLGGPEKLPSLIPTERCPCCEDETDEDDSVTDCGPEGRAGAR